MIVSRLYLPSSSGAARLAQLCNSKIIDSYDFQSRSQDQKVNVWIMRVIHMLLSSIRGMLEKADCASCPTSGQHAVPDLAAELLGKLARRERGYDLFIRYLWKLHIKLCDSGEVGGS